MTDTVATAMVRRSLYRLRVQVCLFRVCYAVFFTCLSTESRLSFIRDQVQGLCFCEHATSYVVRVFDRRESQDVSVKRGAQAVQGRLYSRDKFTLQVTSNMI